MSSLPGDNHPKTVFVVANQLATRRSLSRLLKSLGFEVAVFPSAESFLEQVDSSSPGCVLLDVFGSKHNGVEFERMMSQDYDRPTVVLSSRREIRLAVQAMKAGAVDFLTKPLNSRELAQAVVSALQKDRSLRAARAQLSSVIAEFRSFERRLSTLTPRERQVLPYLLSGERNKQIAFQLGITEKTVKVHRARILEKMEVQSLAGLMRAVSQRGIALGLNIPAA